jgi:aryl-alcohol dehydrogenase-like predicted oxidoreductase
MSRMETRALRPGHTISRVIRGGWQLAGGHGPIEREYAVDDLLLAFDAGITTFDCADIYTGVEELYGLFRQKLLATRGADAVAALKVHTKLVPDLSILSRVAFQDIETIVDTSLQRLKLDCLDLVQFHWWDYDQPKWIDVVYWLGELVKKNKIRFIGVTNFDTPHTRSIVEAGVPLVSMQIQYSVLDHRPENGLADYCIAHDVALLCYGSVAGGFLSDRWLGVPEPLGELENRSLIKYKLIIDDFGGWNLFQELLLELRQIANRHGTDIATIASRYVLDQPGVAAVIVGARNRAHVSANAGVCDIHLTEQDRSGLAAVIAKRQGPLGDTYTLERDRTGRHGSIMKYNLNSVAS